MRKRKRKTMAKESRKITREQAVKELQETLSAVGKDEMADVNPTPSGLQYDGKLIHVRIAARKYGLPEKWLRDKAKEGAVPALIAGYQIFFDEKILAEWLTKQTKEKNKWRTQIFIINICVRHFRISAESL